MVAKLVKQNGCGVVVIVGFDLPFLLPAIRRALRICDTVRGGAALLVRRGQPPGRDRRIADRIVILVL